MAGDWIVWVKGLSRKPEVLTIARSVGWTREEVACRCMEFWEWADAETTDGTILGVSVTDLCDAIPKSTEEFWLALCKVGWLQVDASGITIPRFSRWLGQSAKSRIKKNIRQSHWRNRGGVGADVDMFASTKTSTRVEKSREESLGEESPKNPSCSEPQAASEQTEESAGSADQTTEEPLESHHPRYGAGIKPKPDKPRASGPVQDRGGADHAPDQADEEANPAGDQVLMMFPVVGQKRLGGPTEWPLTQSKLAEYAEAFPGVDVLAEFKKALQWCRVHPTRQKTASGMPQFLFNWLQTAQNRGSYGRSQQGYDSSGGDFRPNSRVRTSQDSLDRIKAKTIRSGQTKSEKGGGS